MVARPSTDIHFQLSAQSYCTDNNVLHHHDDTWRHETGRVARWRASCSCSVFCGRVSTSSDSWWSGVALRTPPGHFSSPTEVYKTTHYMCEILLTVFSTTWILRLQNRYDTGVYASIQALHVRCLLSYTTCTCTSVQQYVIDCFIIKIETYWHL